MLARNGWKFVLKTEPTVLDILGRFWYLLFYREFDLNFVSACPALNSSVFCSVRIFRVNRTTRDIANACTRLFVVTTPFKMQTTNTSGNKGRRHANERYCNGDDSDERLYDAKNVANCPKTRPSPCFHKSDTDVWHAARGTVDGCSTNNNLYTNNNKIHLDFLWLTNKE